ncbi:hypothetical protein [Burkholderia cenocepacia]|uniref:hypothetical protein n=1 Tax=Burkholderia cenocepacia TaxID=95486 RepID=UPI0039EF69F9
MTNASASSPPIATPGRARDGGRGARHAAGGDGDWLAKRDTVFAAQADLDRQRREFDTMRLRGPARKPRCERRC